MYLKNKEKATSQERKSRQMKGWQNEQRRKQIPAGVFLFRLFSLMGYVILLAPFTAGAPLNNLPRQQVLYIMGIALVVLIVSNIIATKLGQSYSFETPRSEDIASDAHGRSSLSKSFGCIVAGICVPIILAIILTSQLTWVLLGCYFVIFLVSLPLGILLWKR
jgi:uncharacterized membrane protein